MQKKKNAQSSRSIDKIKVPARHLSDEPRQAGNVVMTHPAHCKQTNKLITQTHTHAAAEKY
jgi:hypothetical protein